MGRRRKDPGGTRVLQSLSAIRQRACRVDHVVQKHAFAVLDITDDVHHLADVRLFAPLVDDR